jgi:predicted nucleic acid-binding protein
MGSLYLDSSAVVKHYIREKGSAWVRELIDAQENEVTISQLTVVEVAAAVEKRRRMKEISQYHCVRTLVRLAIDYRQRYTIVRVSDPIVELAVDLTSRHPLRAYDAVQLATALRLNQIMLENRLPSLTFVSADGLLCDAAKAEGMSAENPNDHS